MDFFFVAVFFVAVFFVALVFFFTAFLAAPLVELLLVAAFLGVAFLALELALLLDLVAPNTADQPSAYFSFVPTRVIVTVITSMKH